MSKSYLACMAVNIIIIIIIYLFQKIIANTIIITIEVVNGNLNFKMSSICREITNYHQITWLTICMAIVSNGVD